MHVLLEDALKARLAARGLSVPRGARAASGREAAAAMRVLGEPAMVKALVPAGDRGRRGHVTAVEDPDGAAAAADRMLGGELDGFPVDTVLVEARCPAGDEHYLAVSFDFVAGTPILLHGPGGSGVEERPPPVRTPFRLDGPPPLDAVPAALAPVVCALVAEFLAVRARLVELNPVRVTPAGPVVVDAKAVLDPGLTPPDDAYGVRPQRRMTPGERRVADADAAIAGGSSLRYGELGGDIGLVMWGGGASVVILDSLRRLGLSPANYGDLSAGNGGMERLALMADAVLSLPVRAVLAGSSIVSAGSTLRQAEVIAEALRRHDVAGRGVPVVIRLGGPDEGEAATVLSAVGGVTVVGRSVTLEQAVELLAQTLAAGPAGGREVRVGDPAR